MLMISKFMEFLKFVILENEKKPCGFKENTFDFFICLKHINLDNTTGRQK
jgi:hypothetical protein